MRFSRHLRRPKGAHDRPAYRGRHVSYVAMKKYKNKHYSSRVEQWTSWKSMKLLQKIFIRTLRMMAKELFLFSSEAKLKLLNFCLRNDQS